MTQPALTPGKGVWLAALLLAALLHSGLAALAFWSPSQASQGQAKAVGTGGIEISLGPAGRSAGGPEQSPPEPVQAPAVAAEPEPTKAEPERPRPEPVTPPQPVAKPVAEIEPPAKPEQASEPATEPQMEPDTRAAERSDAGAGGHSGSTEQNNTGSGDNSAGGGLPGASDDYAATLLAWLERHKEYPRAARSRRQQGTVLLYFVLDRQGHVSQSRIEQSSGHPLLDAEALTMLQRAQPLPAMPDSMPQSRLELVVPVQFFLR
ncbi:MAG: energy transducer TonB [Alkalimonas sp.]|nr:energy transducer TonB [Alkalimonas sp.]